ncbi:hypothetical protein BJ742DRAFT_743306 [Cladochytrium replicatum]|nr:hypothetical protein BJ742DRAFT_743306 [Cladochytrium replicatum]
MCGNSCKALKDFQFRTDSIVASKAMMDVRKKPPIFCCCIMVSRDLVGFRNFFARWQHGHASLDGLSAFMWMYIVGATSLLLYFCLGMNWWISTCWIPVEGERSRDCRNKLSTPYSVLVPVGFFAALISGHVIALLMVTQILRWRKLWIIRVVRLQLDRAEPFHPDLVFAIYSTAAFVNTTVMFSFGVVSLIYSIGNDGPPLIEFSALGTLSLLWFVNRVWAVDIYNPTVHWRIGIDELRREYREQQMEWEQALEEMGKREPMRLPASPARTGDDNQQTTVAPSPAAAHETIASRA